jgi:uncharacterized membrane protein YbaN (DUF454 family)
MGQEGQNKILKKPCSVIVNSDKTSQILFNTAGTMFVGLGFAGIVLPLLPTTPFLLLAAACYARGSTRFYNWLLNHRWFGSYIQNYRSGAGIPVRVKIIALLVLWVTIGFAAVFTVNLLWIRVGLLALAACISIYLLSLPPLRSKSSCTNQEDER